MSFSKIKLVFASTICLLVAATFLVAPAVEAANSQFFVPEGEDKEINIDDQTENVYVAGNVININASVRKDLIAAGGQININEGVFRSVFVIGNKVSFNLESNEVVQGTVRAIGSEIILSGNFYEDILVAGETITFKNATVRGDVYASGSKIEMIDSQVLGDFSAGVGEIDKESIQDQVRGSVSIDQESAKDFETQTGLLAKTFEEGFGALGFAWLIIEQISLVITLLIIYYILHKYKKTELKSVKLDLTFGKDMLIGLGFLAFPLVVLIASALVLPILIWPLAFNLTLLFYTVYALSQSFLPIYLANLAKNVFGWSMGIGGLTAIAYLLILSVNILALFFNFLFFLPLILFLVGSAAFGYGMRHIIRSLKTSLKEVDNS